MNSLKGLPRPVVMRSRCRFIHCPIAMTSPARKRPVVGELAGAWAMHPSPAVAHTDRLPMQFHVDTCASVSAPVLLVQRYLLLMGASLWRRQALEVAKSSLCNRKSWKSQMTGKTSWTKRNHTLLLRRVSCKTLQAWPNYDPILCLPNAMPQCSLMHRPNTPWTITQCKLITKQSHRPLNRGGGASIPNPSLGHQHPSTIPLVVPVHRTT